ncbi:MAG: TolC family outer membrane protein [Tepidimonas ignava]|uniref:Outer membrane protein n=1 Tax=Tepidimonas ignava TaxID=114249 RepID=A0A4R3LJU0_9BURK|nr:TolC family outer membrane protein [Tepidimonas ignava]MCX7814977.1 TolC family outer membrane protein [Tepidimonas ignava]TCS99768.1 outer membrane protein [Tepidimonas ignava]TSE23153.1 Outer membrane protein TolC [Tepidimonas ignava]
MQPIVRTPSVNPRAKLGRRLSAAALLVLGVATTAQAQSLQALLEAARAYDAAYLAAKAQLDANRAKAEQAKSRVLPTVGLSAEAFVNRRDSSLNTLDDSFNNQTVKLGASHPLYRPGNHIEVEQAQRALQAAEAQLQAAEQDLIVRVAQAYFDVLAAEDTLTFVRAQKAAVEQQLAAAKRNFEVGTATITDTREAQARYDLVLAQEIAADNDLRVKKLALDQLVGQSNTQPWRLRDDTLPTPTPDDVQAWVQRAVAEHPAVRAAQAQLDIAKLDVRKAQAAKGPTLDAVAQWQWNRAPSNNPPFPYLRNQVASIGVQFNLPLYTGGALDNRIAETVALEDKARNDLEAATRNVSQATRAAFFGVQSGLGQVRALQAAEASSQLALEANQVGYQVGVRINIDVLNAQSQLYQTKAQLAKARYDVLVGQLKLRQAAGVLGADDVKPINERLQPR